LAFPQVVGDDFVHHPLMEVRWEGFHLNIGKHIWPD
jgi:hypothetical protein